ncbi:MAG: efflux RND transporter periplasmic adaptor subunit [Gammaproteobacteria bacterium]
MNTRKLFMLATGGIIAGLFSVFFYNENLKAQEPLSVSYNPYDKGIYASGIIESFQLNGSNINIFPEVSGRVSSIMVSDGQQVKKEDVLLVIHHSVQTAIVEKDKANVKLAQDNLITVQDQYDKLKKAYDINPKSVSKNALDNANNAVISAKQNISVAQAQQDSDQALLDEYTITSPVDGVVLRVVPAVGDYASPVVGTYDTYTQGSLPIIQIGQVTPYLQVRVYVDEILTPQLPESSKLEATLFVRGMDNKSIPLKYVNMQPYTIPNIQLSDQRSERVDVRVLPIIFQFEKPTDINLYPGQLVDVYIKGKP